MDELVHGLTSPLLSKATLAPIMERERERKGDRDRERERDRERDIERERKREEMEQEEEVVVEEEELTLPLLSKAKLTKRNNLPPTQGESESDVFLDIGEEEEEEEEEVAMDRGANRRLHRGPSSGRRGSGGELALGMWAMREEGVGVGEGEEPGMEENPEKKCGPYPTPPRFAPPSDHPYSFLGESPLELAAAGQPPSSLDPFRNHTPHINGFYEWLKVAVCLPLALVRLVLVLLFTLLGLLLTKAALVGWKLRDRPLPAWRSKLMYSTRLCARGILFCFGYHWICRTGKAAGRDVASIIVSNHISFTDPLFYFYELFPIIVTSSSHDTVPVIGTVIRAMQVIYVDRLSPESRRRARDEIKRKALDNGFPHVLLFPEGTTTNGRSLIYFQLGAFTPGLPVQPVILRYPFVHFDASWGKISVVKLIFRMVTQFHNFMEVEYLPVVYPSSKQKNGPLMFADRVKHIMAKSLNVPKTDYSYGDLVLYGKAASLKLGAASSYMVEMGKVEKALHLNTMEAIKLLEKFSIMDSRHNGFMREDEFIKALNLPLIGFSQKIFAFFDKGKQGSITFKEFLAGSAFILKHPSFEQLAQEAFESCGSCISGFLTCEELEHALKLVFPDITDSQMNDLFNKMNIVGRDAINFEGFKCFLERYPELLVVFLPLNNSFSMYT